MKGKSLSAAVILLFALALRPAEAAAARPDAVLYKQAKTARAALAASDRLLGRTSEWEKVIVRYRKVVARYPQSGYCDDALLAVGDLYRQMAERFRSSRYVEDSVLAYRTLVAEYPASRHGEKALYSVFEMAQASGDRRRLAEAGRTYLAAYPEATRAPQVKALLRKRTPAQAASLPAPPPPGLARVFDLRSWSGASSTRVVIHVEKRVPVEYDRIGNPDRLWVDLVGTRLHPNLANRSFPVGDGLLEKVRIAQNRPHAVRVVLDFKSVTGHTVFYLEDPPRLVVDVRGTTGPPVADVTEPAPPPPPSPASTPSAGAEQTSVPAPAPTASPATAEAVETPPERRLPALVTESPPQTAAATPPPQPPEVNRAGSYSLARQLGLGVRRIVVDPGHGGHDPGTIGRGGLQEKDLVLDVALRLERLVRSELGAEVVMTRSTDVFIPLEERTAIANSRGADLFLSIHANSSRNPRARGIETYFLSFAANAHAQQVAARENAISQATLKDLQSLVKAIALNSKADESRDFAASVQEAMVEQLRPHYPGVQDRGVHSAPFYVLIGANMPSVLAEIAFVSHPEEERILKRAQHRELLARSMLAGVRRYLQALDRNRSRPLTPAALDTTSSAPRLQSRAAVPPPLPESASAVPR